ncbi:MAG: response regulator [Bacteroidales bacterium]|nr:response regulator [Bacteroidales bacterium]
MRIKGVRKGRGVSPLSYLISDIKSNKWYLFSVIVILFSIAGIIVSSIFNLTVYEIILAAIILVAVTIMIFSDKNREISRNNQIQELQDSMEKKERFIADFSHSIRTPLSNFSLIINHLTETDLNDNQRELLETLSASTGNMGTVVDDLTRITAREISFEPRKKIKFNLVSSLQNTIELFKPEHQGNIKFNIKAGKDIDKNYMSDPVTIKQIFLDLFNSFVVKNISNLEVDISLEIVGTSGKAEIIESTISANKTIQFLRYDHNNPGTIKSISAKLIIIEGGKYSTTTSEKGSVFKFTFPFEPVIEEKKISEVAKRIKELNTSRDIRKNLSDADILLVEDNSINQKIVSITLQSIVKSIDTAQNGKEALDMFGKSNYDLILMDVQLPVMDGITAVRKIRELEASTSIHTPIIAITANAMIGDKEKCLSAGMDEYISKPFQPGQLIGLIEKLISS